MTIDKALGYKLRMEGKTQVETALALGCSIDWVKRNLKGIKKPNKDKPIIDTIRCLGCRPNGVTTGEIKQIVKEHYPTVCDKTLTDKVASLKRSARKGHPDVIIRPYWMMPECPHQCITTMMDMGQHVYELIDQLADRYRQLYDLDVSYHRNVMYQLSALSAQDNNKLLPQGLLTYGESLDTIACVIDERNTL